MALSAFSFCLMTVFVKIAGQSLGTFQIVLFRGIFTLLLTLIIIKKKNIYLWGKNHKILAFRGLSGTIALFFVYESIQRLSLSEATVIQYLYPIFTTLLASLLISEKTTKKLYLAIFIGFSGIYVVLNFPFLNNSATFDIENTFIAIMGAFLTGLAYVLVRLSSKLDESPYIIMFYFPLFTVPLSLPFVILNWSNPEPQIWGVLFLVGIFTQLGQTFLTFGYKLLPASTASTASYVQVPFSALAGAFIFHESISYNFIFGSFLILIAMLLIIKKKENKNISLI